MMASPSTKAQFLEDFVVNDFIILTRIKITRILFVGRILILWSLLQQPSLVISIGRPLHYFLERGRGRRSHRERRNREGRSQEKKKRRKDLLPRRGFHLPSSEAIQDLSQPVPAGQSRSRSRRRREFKSFIYFAGFPANQGTSRLDRDIQLEAQNIGNASKPSTPAGELCRHQNPATKSRPEKKKRWRSHDYPMHTHLATIACCFVPSLCGRSAFQLPWNLLLEPCCCCCRPTLLKGKVCTQPEFEAPHHLLLSKAATHQPKPCRSREGGKEHHLPLC